MEALVKYDREHEYVLVRFSEKNPVEGMEQLVVKSPSGKARDPMRIFFSIPKKLEKQHSHSLCQLICSRSTHDDVVYDDDTVPFRQSRYVSNSLTVVP